MAETNFVDALFRSMNKLNLLWMIPSFMVVFGAFWCFIAKGLSLLAWGRLASEYLAPDPVGLPVQIRIARAKLGVVSYKGAIKAGASLQGLALRAAWLFGVGHPPLLIPWSAIAPIRTHKVLWTTYYSTTIEVSSGQVDFQFSDSELAQALRPWLRME
jgi:hypothetical protein